MRIISSFKDYYDSLQSHSDLVFHRNPQKINMNRDESKVVCEVFNKINLLDRRLFHQFLVGFCGKIYPAISFKNEFKSEVCFDRESFNNLVKVNFSSDEQEDYFRSSFQKTIANFFEKKGDSCCSSLFEKYQSPIFIIYSSGTSCQLIVNPCLREIGFFRLFSSYQAYQEVFMFVSNLASPEKPIPEIDNDIMIEAKGFNLQTSFRKNKKCVR